MLRALSKRYGFRDVSKNRMTLAAENNLHLVGEVVFKIPCYFI